MDKLEDHFAMAIIAPRKSGKSFLVSTMLRSGLSDRFDHVIILCPTIDFNDDYLEFSDNPKFKLIHDVKSSLIDELFETQAQCKKDVQSRKRKRKLTDLRCPRTLLILDDCIDSGVMDFKGTVDKIAERGRHIELSTIMMSQRMSAVSRSIRLNSDYIIIFSPFSISEVEQFLEQFVSRNKRKEMRGVLDNVFNIKRQFILLDNMETAGKKIKTSNASDFVKNIVTSIDIGEVTSKRKIDNSDSHIDIEQKVKKYKNSNMK